MLVLLSPALSALAKVLAAALCYDNSNALFHLADAAHLDKRHGQMQIYLVPRPQRDGHKQPGEGGEEQQCSSGSSDRKRKITKAIARASYR